MWDDHGIIHTIAVYIAHYLTSEAPTWLHPVLHIVLFWAPLGLLFVIAILFTRTILKRFRLRRTRPIKESLAEIPSLPGNVFSFVRRYSYRQQAALIAIGLAAMPVLYATLELPKIIINNVIGSDQFPITHYGIEFSKVSFLLTLSALYLLAITTNGAIKFWINVYKGRVGERILRRLRLTVFRLWRHGTGSQNRAEVIPLITQEVEPVGGFAAEACALPVFEGGTFLTVLMFMFIQDPVLAAAALTLLPVQLALIPRLQRNINQLARRRVGEVRALCGHLGEQANAGCRQRQEIHNVGLSLKRIETIRRQIHQSKFFLKSLNNFLTALTPFFFYAIGGYLVIEGRLTLGALVAVLAAYKDFSAPLRELFRYYQTAEDVRVRYSEIRRFFSTGESQPTLKDQGQNSSSELLLFSP